MNRKKFLQLLSLGTVGALLGKEGNQVRTPDNFGKGFDDEERVFAESEVLTIEILEEFQAAGKRENPENAELAAYFFDGARSEQIKA